MKGLVLVLLLALQTLAFAAPPCSPDENSSEYEAMEIERNGRDMTQPAYVVWDCYGKRLDNVLQAPRPTRHCLVAAWADIDLRRLGDRSDTIVRSADQRKAFAAAWARFVTNDKDPRCIEILKRITERERAVSG